MGSLADTNAAKRRQEQRDRRHAIKIEKKQLRDQRRIDLSAINEDAPVQPAEPPREHYDVWAHHFRVGQRPPAQGEASVSLPPQDGEASEIFMVDRPGPGSM